MGAQTFEDRAQGKTAKEAFSAAQEQAYWEHGHGGYTGTIAEKPGFVLATGRKAGETAQAFLDRLNVSPPQQEPGEPWRAYDERCRRFVNTLGDRSLDRDQMVYDDKWGPALCVKGDEPDEWIFCGWASS
jgi:hypothetical protein